MTHTCPGVCDVCELVQLRKQRSKADILIYNLVQVAEGKPPDPSISEHPYILAVQRAVKKWVDEVDRLNDNVKTLSNAETELDNEISKLGVRNSFLQDKLMAASYAQTRGATVGEAFVAGVSWWEFHKTGATLWSSDRDLAEQEAAKRNYDFRPSYTKYLEAQLEERDRFIQTLQNQLTLQKGDTSELSELLQLAVECSECDLATYGLGAVGGYAERVKNARRAKSIWLNAHAELNKRDES